MDCYMCDCPMEQESGYKSGKKHFCCAECMGEYIDNRNEGWGQEGCGYDQDYDYIPDCFAD